MRYAPIYVGSHILLRVYLLSGLRIFKHLSTGSNSYLACPLKKMTLMIIRNPISLKCCVGVNVTNLSLKYRLTISFRIFIKHLVHLHANLQHESMNKLRF